MTVPPTPLETIMETPMTTSSDAPPSYDRLNGEKQNGESQNAYSLFGGKTAVDSKSIKTAASFLGPAANTFSSRRKSFICGRHTDSQLLIR